MNLLWLFLHLAPIKMIDCLGFFALSAGSQPHYGAIDNISTSNFR